MERFLLRMPVRPVPVSCPPFSPPIITTTSRASTAMLQVAIVDDTVHTCATAMSM